MRRAGLQRQVRRSAAASGHAPEPVRGQSRRSPRRLPALPPNVAYDLTLQHPRCVFQLLKQQYSRYTPETVERITGIPKDQFLKAVDLFTSIRKDGDMKKVGDDHLRGRLDAAHLRHANHPHRGDDSAAARQRRTRGRRRERAARPFEYSGRHGHGRHFRQSARIPENADSDRHGSGHIPEAHHPDSFETHAVGFVELLLEHAEILRVVLEGDVRRRGDQGKRISHSIICRKSTAIIPGRRSGTTCTTAR